MFGTTNTGMTGIQFQNTSVKFSLQSTPDFADYPYRGQFANSGITAQAYAEVVYSGTQASSGNYAPFCQTYDGGVYLYAKTNVGTQTIPTIAIGTASFSLTLDNGVTQGSQNPVTSGAVYSALNWKVLWSNNAGINDKNTYSLSEDPTTFHELMIIARSESANVGFASQVISTIGLTPSNTYSRDSWDSWNACSFPTEDGNSNIYAITIQFMPLKTFKIAYYWHSKLFAILAR